MFCFPDFNLPRFLKVIFPRLCDFHPEMKKQPVFVQLLGFFLKWLPMQSSFCHGQNKSFPD